jgi:hypothetical protein
VRTQQAALVFFDQDIPTPNVDDEGGQTNHTPVMVEADGETLTLVLPSGALAVRSGGAR